MSLLKGPPNLTQPRTSVPIEGQYGTRTGIAYKRMPRISLVSPFFYSHDPMPRKISVPVEVLRKGAVT